MKAEFKSQRHWKAKLENISKVEQKTKHMENQSRNSNTQIVGSLQRIVKYVKEGITKEINQGISDK